VYFDSVAIMISSGILTPSRIVLRFVLLLDHRPASGDQLNKKHNQRNHEQDVNEPAERIAADDAEQP
jgi:hypothetical protein